MKQDVGLVVLEHLRDQLDVHVLDVDLLTRGQSRAQTDGTRPTSRLLFMTTTASFSFSCAASQMVRPGLCQRRRTTLVMMRDSRRFCWCSWGLSCSLSANAGQHKKTGLYFHVLTMVLLDVKGVGGRDAYQVRLIVCTLYLRVPA